MKLAIEEIKNLSTEDLKRCLLEIKNLIKTNVSESCLKNDFELSLVRELANKFKDLYDIREVNTLRLVIDLIKNEAAERWLVLIEQEEIELKKSEKFNGSIIDAMIKKINNNKLKN